MDWRTIAVLAVLTCLVTIALLRVERRQRRTVLPVLPLPALLLVWRWSCYRDMWLGPILGIVLGLLASWIWRRLRGRHLPPPTRDNIRVWAMDLPFND